MIKYLVLCLFLFGCTMKGELTDESKHKQVSCKDMRDGEIFLYHTDNVSNLRIGLGADSCFDVVDDAGIYHHLCQNQAIYLKCSVLPVFFHSK